MQLTDREIPRRAANLRIAGGILGAALAGCGRRVRGEDDAKPRVVTVLGSIPAERMGRTLTHEHVLVDFIGAAEVSRDRYDADAVFERVLPFLERAKAAGCETFVDATPAYLGRDAELLRRLSKKTGLHIVTNTGYYGARENRYLPEHAMSESADALAARWIAEARDGIDGTDVRPGFIKIGVDAGKLSKIHEKLVRAAARTHLQSGLTISVHTGDGAAAFDELRVLKEERVSPSALIWVHAQSEKDSERHARFAREGGWVSFDGLGPGSLERDLHLLRAAKDQGFLERALLSHDAGWYSVGEENGGTFRGFEHLFTRFIPELGKAGFSAEEVERLVAGNPRAAFAVRARRA